MTRPKTPPGAKPVLAGVDGDAPVDFKGPKLAFAHHPMLPEKGHRDFHWLNTDEPHKVRQREIIKRHPEVRELMKPEPMTLPISIALVVSQFLMANFVHDKSWPVFLIAAYAFGGTINHTLQLAQHELSHLLAFGNGAANKLLAIFCNLPTGVPSSQTFRLYHMEHHQYQGVDAVDADIPCEQELFFFQSRPLKIVWLLCQSLFYAGRPSMIKPRAMSFWEGVNFAFMLVANVLIVYYLGFWYLGYFLACDFLGMGIHPCAGHFIAEHYEFVPDQETYSYYGTCNYFNFNVGYHNEHHDFPKVPWSRLPLLRSMAPEFYMTKPYYTSYWAVLWHFMSDSCMGTFSRVKRTSKTPSKETKKTK